MTTVGRTPPSARAPLVALLRLLLNLTRDSSAGFIALLKTLDGAYPAHQKIRLVLETIRRISPKRRVDSVPQRFAFAFTPKHGSWLNPIENQFSKMA